MKNPKGGSVLQFFIGFKRIQMEKFQSEGYKKSIKLKFM